MRAVDRPFFPAAAACRGCVCGVGARGEKGWARGRDESCSETLIKTRKSSSRASKIELNDDKTKRGRAIHPPLSHARKAFVVGTPSCSPQQDTSLKQFKKSVMRRTPRSRVQPLLSFGAREISLKHVLPKKKNTRGGSDCLSGVRAPLLTSRAALFPSLARRCDACRSSLEG